MAGLRAAQHRLYQKYADAMYNICCRMTNDSEAASEVLQDAFMAVFEKIATYNHQSTLGAWIKKIVIHKCIDYIRLKKMSFAEINESITAIPETDETPVHINVDVIREAISQLPEGYRLVFTLYAMEGYDHEEIAQILKISEQTSKSQYHRAKGKIKEWIYKNGQMEALYN
ncbi:MAG: sigma-70 family RNA polymerase sigma factor [Saprospiraceae bacterium]|nr:sigma-70 family RNA polymerase sigma factor [Saprospiraceae bacterium]